MTRHEHNLVSSGKEALRGAFLEGMSRTAATVTVVTTDGAAGRAGVTVSALSSVTADGPAPALLVCIHAASTASRPILQNRVFAVNVLRDDQTRISEVFAGRSAAPDGDKFACAAWATGTTGAPRLVDSLAAFDCRLTVSRRLGTHHVLFGAVENVFVGGEGGPLIYANRAYGGAMRYGALA